MASNDGSFHFADGNSINSKCAINVDNTNECAVSDDHQHNNHELSMEGSDAHTETDEYHANTLFSDDGDDNIQTPAQQMLNI